MCIQFCCDNNNNNKVTLAALYTCTEYSVFTMIIIMITKEFYYIPNSIHIYLIINYTYIDNKIRLIRWEIGREPWGTLLPRRDCKASFEPCLGPWDIERELRETLLPRWVCEAIARRDGREPWGTLGALGNPDTIARWKGALGNPGRLGEPWYHCEARWKEPWATLGSWNGTLGHPVTFAKRVSRRDVREFLGNPWEVGTGP